MCEKTSVSTFFEPFLRALNHKYLRRIRLRQNVRLTATRRSPTPVFCAILLGPQSRGFLTRPPGPPSCTARATMPTLPRGHGSLLRRTVCRADGQDGRCPSGHACWEKTSAPGGRVRRRPTARLSQDHYICRKNVTDGRGRVRYSSPE